MFNEKLIEEKIQFIEIKEILSVVFYKNYPVFVIIFLENR